MNFSPMYNAALCKKEVFQEKQGDKIKLGKTSIKEKEGQLRMQCSRS